MSAPEPSPPARPLFRRLAGLLSVCGYILAALSLILPAADPSPGRHFYFGPAFFVCLAVGAIMGGIALTGRWPWWGRDKR